MEFRHKKLNRTISFLYGFKKSKSVYDFVMTIEKKGNTSNIHAWLVKVDMTPKDLHNMWDALKLNFKTRYFQFEVLEQHKRFYERVFQSIECKKIKSFDGYPTYLLKIHRKCELIVGNF